MRSCPFCDNPANSAEHVYPMWLTRHYSRSLARPGFTMEMPPAFGGTRTARTLNQTVKVCARCNNGWMSRLEASVGPLILRLLADAESSLDLQQQELLSRWLFKMAVLHEFVAEEERVSTAAARAQLAGGQVPGGWSAHIARSQAPFETTFQYLLGSMASFTHPDGSHRGRARLHTMRLGQLTTQVLLHSLDVHPTVENLLGGPLHAARLWPVTEPEVPWPPGVNLLPDWFTRVGNLTFPERASGESS